MMKLVLILVLVSRASAWSTGNDNGIKKQPLLHSLEKLQKEDQTEANDILKVAYKQGARKFVSLVYRVGLSELLKLQTIGDFTLFLPNDKAFRKLPGWVYPYLLINGRAARAIVLFHLTKGRLNSTNIHNEETIPSLYDRSELRINIYNNNSIVTVSGAKVVRADIPASNGIVHLLDRVILSVPTSSLAYVLSKCPIFETLWRATLLTNLTDTISGNPLTLFAPSDRAFFKLPAGFLRNLTKHPEKLKAVLEYHMVNSSLYSAGLIDGENVTTLEGGSLSITIKDSTTKVNDARLVFADGNVRNGVLHVIDRVLLPEEMMIDLESENVVENNIQKHAWLNIVKANKIYKDSLNQLPNSPWIPEKL